MSLQGRDTRDAWKTTGIEGNARPGRDLRRTSGGVTSGNSMEPAISQSKRGTTRRAVTRGSRADEGATEREASESKGEEPGSALMVLVLLRNATSIQLPRRPPVDGASPAYQCSFPAPSLICILDLSVGPRRSPTPFAPIAVVPLAGYIREGTLERISQSTTTTA